MNQKVANLETEKNQARKDCTDLQKRVLDLEDNFASSERALLALKEQSEEEKMELFAHIQELEKELTSLSSTALLKERECMRKELEKAKSKLKEMENKLKNVVQEKTKLEGEKASTERELKFLQGQNLRLERDINRRESLASRQRDSLAIDLKRPKSHAPVDQTMQDDYNRLEFRAFEMEATITSLEEELAAAHKETDEVVQKCESLTSELAGHSDKINSLNLELTTLREEVTGLTVQLDVSKTKQEKIEASLNKQITENEELANQLANSLLQMEEERALWLTKEKACTGAVAEKDKLYNLEITSLRKEICNLTNERVELNAQSEKLQKSSIELEMKFSDARTEVHNLLSQISAIEDEVNKGKEKAKLRMRLHWTQAKLDSTRNRLTEAVVKQDLMHRKFEEASRELKDRLRACATENLNLRKELASLRGHDVST
ncbi:hypothetical protein MLD38_004485 [Melastoma candidum]|uniref:Uncharacterized protein n=1 Tax=Melastoma candidum TaxID=119954 RepID=A0ACB9S5R9_9MYRT|nr:hypothetical protein MLD38_004485 [Melastoma candidum]